MCGICGFWSRNLAPDRAEEIVLRMTRVLTHRGPDGHGFFSAPPVALGHARLKIIDLITGQQPLCSDRQNVVLVYNGEIYNFRELKDDLARKGYSFHTKTDTEVLLNLYQEYGTQCVDRINGMFAFVLWDREKDVLWGARDRMGLKPLYYFRDNDYFIFASEMKAILAHPHIRRDLNLSALRQFLFLDYIPAPHTIFKNIYKLPPGVAFTFQRGSFSLAPFWNLSFSANSEVGERETIEKLRGKLLESVNKRMVGDVPFGLLLSGGVDSSALLVLMKQLGLSAPKAFTISFPERSFNENSYAKRMADLVGATYYEEELNSKKAYELIHPITDHMDEPLADPSLVPTWLLSSLAREHVTFVLGGDGGDELFGGYPSFEFQKLLSFIEPFESIAGTLIRRMSRWRRPSPDYRGIQFVVDKLVSGAGLPLPLKHLAWLGAFPLSEISSLMSTSLGNAVTDDIREDVLRSWSQTEGSPVFNRLQSLYFRYYLAEGILVKVDRASMAHSLEVRNPYLDFELVDFVNSIPNSLKMRGLITKYALKKCFQHHIPKDILFRRKQGFAVPIAKWLREDFRELLQDLLSPPRIRAQGLFDPDRVQGYVKEHLSGDVDHRKRLWSLLMFQLWEQKWNRPA